MSKPIYYIIQSNSFGDTLAATPTLRHLSKVHKNKINVVTHNKNVFNNNPYVEKCFSFDEYKPVYNSTVYNSFTYAGRKDGNNIEKKFSRIDTRQLHAMDLGFQLLPEEMEYDFYPDKFSMDVNLPEKYVVLHITTNWPNRTWSNENWQNLINWLSDNKIFTVLIGFGYREELHNSYSDKPLEKICPVFKNLYGLDLTNQGSISDMWWVLNNSQCLVTMDSGPLHLAGCTDVNIIQLGSALNPKLRAPYRKGSQEYKYWYAGGSCNIFCNSNLEYNVKEWGDINSVPPQPYCLENKPTYECHPSFNKVVDILKGVLNVEHKEIVIQPETTSLNYKKSVEKTKFGIYTSFYNSERFVERAFTNIENLNYSNFEWHITDDFSSDKTKELLLKRIEKSHLKDKIKYYDQEYKKQMYWKPSEFFDETYDWIVLVDSDDDVDHEFLNVYNNVISNVPDLALISSDGHKINEIDNSLHSITYVLNDDKISNKIDRYHPSCDYLNNLNYSCFGLLRAFNHKIVKDFVIDDNLACAEDSYRVFWCNSFGKYLHIPRPMYKWILRNDSESHSIGVRPNFNGNFDNALKKLKQSDYGVDTTFNDVYIETSALGSYPLSEMNNKSVVIWSRNLSENQKNKLSLLYHDVMLKFNQEGGQINIVCLNHFNEEELDLLLNKDIKSNILFYYQNQKHHTTNQSKDNEINSVSEKYRNVISKHMTSYSWWSYIRHLIIKN